MPLDANFFLRKRLMDRAKEDHKKRKEEHKGRKNSSGLILSFTPALRPICSSLRFLWWSGFSH
jgi:hypothetical protein